MEMIPSELSGVAFSLNPTNNDYDEAVINANYGLGETIVSGVINPDFFIVNKIKKLILTKKLGKKEYYLNLKQDGGSEEIKDSEKSNKFCLTNIQILEIIDSLEKLENLYQDIPIDIEWAFFKGKLYILQARPITTYLKLPKILRTEKNENRILYFDITLVVQGFDKPFSILGSTLLEILFTKLGERVFGVDDFCHIRRGVPGIVGGKLYANVSNIFSKVGKDTIGKFVKNMNPDVGEIILKLFELENLYYDENYDSKNEKEEDKIKRLNFHRYSSNTIPNALDFCKLGMFWRMPVTKFIFPNFFLNRIKDGVISGIEDFENEFKKHEEFWRQKNKSLRYICENLFWEFTYLLSQRLIPAVGNGIRAYNNIKTLFEDKAIIFSEENEESNAFKIDELLKRNHHTKYTKKEINFLIENLIISLPNNITTKMGLELYELSEVLFKNNKHNELKFSEISFEDFLILFDKSFKSYLKSNNKSDYCKINLLENIDIDSKAIIETQEYKNLFDDNFLNSYFNFIEKYGMRGEKELDMSNPRYREEPKFLLNQIFNSYKSIIKKEKNKFDININDFKEIELISPKEVFEEADKNRIKIYDKLYQIAENYNFESEFHKAFELVINLAGYRETPKYYVIKTLSFIREIILELAEIFLKLNLIENKIEIFNLKIEEIFEIYDNKLKNLISFKNLIFPTKNSQKIDISYQELLILENMKKELKIAFEKNNKERKIFMDWHTTPNLIDSRGRILKNENKKVKPGEIIGESVSFGKVKGRVNVMKTANEKHFENGDILVTKATDPGWTPLIISSGGMILEIGGMLQHGALVAREFNKPCIVGVENAMKLFNDNDLVEIDANHGIIRKLN